MSSVPPEPPAADAAVVPWEQRRGGDPFRAFVETVKLFVLRPEEAWRATPERGGFESPLLFGLIVSFVGAAIAFLYRWIFGSPFARMFPASALHRWGGAYPWGRPRPFGCALVAFPFVSAIGILIGLFVGTAVIHVFLLIVGGTRSSSSGFEGTFRALSYGSVSSLAQVIPFVGGLIALVWWVVLTVQGLVRMHRTTPGRALAAVLMPIALIVVLVVFVAIVVVGLFVATRHGSATI